MLEDVIALSFALLTSIGGDDSKLRLQLLVLRLRLLMMLDLIEIQRQRVMRTTRRRQRGLLLLVVHRMVDAVMIVSRWRVRWMRGYVMVLVVVTRMSIALR